MFDPKDTTNYATITVSQGMIISIVPIPRSMTPENAVYIAAWLYVMASMELLDSEMIDEKFMELVNNIRNT